MHFKLTDSFQSGVSAYDNASTQGQTEAAKLLEERAGARRQAASAKGSADAALVQQFADAAAEGNLTLMGEQMKSGVSVNDIDAVRCQDHGLPTMPDVHTGGIFSPTQGCNKWKRRRCKLLDPPWCERRRDGQGKGSAELWSVVC